MSSRLCPWCMQMTDADTCPHCGKSTDYTCLPVHLPAGYVVHGKHPYVLGAALGQGGFGITYIALDMQTNERVAIKEYFPTFCANRTDGAVWSYPNQEDVFLRGRDRFLDEARVLKSLSDLSSIVNVLDFFERNNSAYLVMEFLEGDSLKAYAKKHGRFPAQSFLQQLRPLMEDLDRMHQRGVVHRDIAPDNIILTPDGQLKLIDFGAARSYVGDKSMTVVVKKGFAPIEQYMRHGSTAATDVYALAATIYYCITGTVPPDSAERQYDEDMLKSPISLGAELSREQEQAILKALEVQPKKRTQSVAELIKALEHAPRPEKQKPVKAVEKPQPIKEEEKPKPVKKTEKSEKEPKKKVKWIIPAIAAALLCIVGTVLFMGKESPIAPVETAPQQMEVPETTIPETEPPVILSEEAQKYNEAVDFFNNDEYGKAAIAFAKLGDYRDAREKSFALWKSITGREESLDGGFSYTVGLKSDGAVIAASDRDSAPFDVYEWTDIVAISAGDHHIVGLKTDSTVVASVRSGRDEAECEVSDWKDIVAISAGDCYTVGLKANGRVVAVGDNQLGQCDVSGWRDIVAISAGGDHTVGLKADGTVVAVGYSNYTEAMNISYWSDIVAISAGDYHTVGLRTNGTVVVKGKDSHYRGSCDVSDWTDIVAISAGSGHIVGLKADGTVVAVGDNDEGQCDVSQWQNIVAIGTGLRHTIGLKEDGTVVAVGSNVYDQCSVSDWTDIRLPADRDALLAAIDLDYITEE